MFTRVDHLMICVPDLERGTEQYRRMGFNIQPGGVHPGRGTHNAIAFNEEEYLELLAIRDPAEERAAERGGRLGRRPSRFHRGGRRHPLRHRAERRPGGGRRRDARARRGRGRSPRWKPRAERPDVPVEDARLGPKNPLPLFFIQHLTPMAERRKYTPGAGPHPNGVRFLERVYIVVNDLEASVARTPKCSARHSPGCTRAR